MFSWKKQCHCLTILQKHCENCPSPTPSSSLLLEMDRSNIYGPNWQRAWFMLQDQPPPTHDQLLFFVAGYHFPRLPRLCCELAQKVPTRQFCAIFCVTNRNNWSVADGGHLELSPALVDVVLACPKLRTNFKISFLKITMEQARTSTNSDGVGGALL